MTCEEVRALLPAYADGELHLAGEIDVHLSTCEACSAELEAYRRMLGELSRMQETGPAPAIDLYAKVVGLIPAPSLAGRMRLAVFDNPALYAAIAGGVAAAVGAVYFLYRRSQRVAELA
jgi:anti-sigma factor RsiW